MSHSLTVPPYSNRGAQNTFASGLIACLDWLQVTFKNASNPHEIVHLLGLKNELFETISIGKFGYKSQLRLGHIVIYFDDDIEHCHLEITGQGCREYESYNALDWSVLLSHILMLNVNITRLDLAIDDYKGYFRIQTLYKKLKKAECRSKFKSFRYMVKQKITDKEITGQTIYLGSPQSRLMVRFYDKLAERKSKNYDVKDDITFWNRTELQLRDERALAAAVLIANKDDVSPIITGVLRNYITFVNPKNDKNRSRWPEANFWIKFLNDAEKLKLTEKSPEKDIVQIKEWFSKNMTPTLSMLYEAFDNDIKLVEEFLETGKEKRSERHEKLLDRWFKEREEKEELKRQRKLNLIGTRFEINDNGQVILKIKKNHSNNKNCSNDSF